MNIELNGTPSHVPTENVVDIDIYSLPGSEVDFHGAWLQLQSDDGPEILWTPRNEGHWIVTRGKEIKQILSDFDTFSSDGVYIPKPKQIEHVLLPLQADPPEQTEYRRAINKIVAPKSVLAMQEPISALAAEIAATLAPKGRCEFISEVADVFPIKLFLAFAGLPMEDFDRLRPLGATFVRRNEDELPEDDMFRLTNEYLDPIVRERMANPGNDIFSQVFSTPIFGKPMSYDIAMGIGRDLLLAGLDTVSSHVGFIGYHLAMHPDQRKAINENSKLLATAVDDLMRRYNSVSLNRQATRDVEIGGVTLKKGDLVSIPLPLYNLDDRLFDDPLGVIIDKPRGEHMGFGAGVHRCPGNALARLELMTFMREWLAKIPDFAIDPAYPVRMKSGIVGTIEELHLMWEPA